MQCVVLCYFRKLKWIKFDSDGISGREPGDSRVPALQAEFFRNVKDLFVLSSKIVNVGYIKNYN